MSPAQKPTCRSCDRTALPGSELTRNSCRYWFREMPRSWSRIFRCRESRMLHKRLQSRALSCRTTYMASSAFAGDLPVNDKGSTR
jgi:hypothetical protein